MRRPVVAVIMAAVVSLLNPTMIKTDAYASNTTSTDNVYEEWESLGKFKLTAYCNCRKCNGKWAYGPTKSGVMPVEGITIAVDEHVIPMGSKVKIGDHVYTAHDTGKHIKGNRIDIYIDNHSRASDFGVKYAEVYVKR